MTVVEGTRIGPRHFCLTEKSAIKLQAAQEQLIRRGTDEIDVVRERWGLFWRVEVWRWRPAKEASHA